jgi:hypothetical protein
MHILTYMVHLCTVDVIILALHHSNTIDVFFVNDCSDSKLPC